MTAKEWLARVDAVAARLEAHARSAHEGLTAPDAGDSEQWAADHVFAHIQEFIPYWIGQIQHVINEYDDTPVAFGRTKADTGRRAAVAAHGEHSLTQRWTQIHLSLMQLRDFIQSFDDSAWQVQGQHSTRGALSMDAMLQEFLVGHLEEHADQLDTIAA